MRAFRKAILFGWLIAAALPAVVARAQSAESGQGRPAVPATVPAVGTQARSPGVVVPSTDPAAIGRDVLNAGPDPRVRLDGLSRDHAAIFGTQDEDEQALLDNERALQAQQGNCTSSSAC